ncbi:hypothetical protein C8R45DRAFT_941891 [Mycena sanguinolenta]|nr:hypothetical protein C8R45DRAFT_941891 [Mycena sanguinolenta]
MPGLPGPGLDMFIFWALAISLSRDRHPGSLQQLNFTDLGSLFFLTVKKPGFGPGSGLQARHPGLGLGPGEYEARARPSRARAQAFRPSWALDITTTQAPIAPTSTPGKNLKKMGA